VPFACPNCAEPCGPEDIIEKNGKEYCPECVPFACPNCAEPCDPEDVFKVGDKQHCPKCWEPERRAGRPDRSAPEPFTCPNCEREMEPEDVMPGPDGRDYCPACYPEEDDDDSDEEYPAAPGFSAPKPVKKERQRIARVRKVVKQYQDDEHVAPPRAFGAPSASQPQPKPQRRRSVRVRTVVHEHEDDEGIHRPRAFGRQPTRADRERREHG